MLNNLDDTVTVTLSSLQQELKNYQSNLSQQLLRMYSQQQQGEQILAEFIDRFEEKLDQSKADNSQSLLTPGTPTVLQHEPYTNGFSETSSQQIVNEPISVLSPHPPEVDNSSNMAVIVPPIEKPSEPVPDDKYTSTSTSETPSEPISVLTNDLSVTQIPTPSAMFPSSTEESASSSTSETPSETPSEPISVLTNDLSVTQIPTPSAMFPSSTEESASSSTPETPSETPSEPISVLTNDLSVTQIPTPSAMFPSSTEESASSSTPETPSETPSEPISVLTNDLSVTQIPTPSAMFPSSTEESASSSTPETPSETPSEPISVLTNDLSVTQIPTPSAMFPSSTEESASSSTPETPSETPSEPVSVISNSEKNNLINTPLKPQPPIKPSNQRSRSRNSPNWSPVQIGFLLVVLSTVMSSLYNVVVKALFHSGSNLLGNSPTQQLIPPTLGNIFFILMLRLLVVVPLMLLLSPILHPTIWQDLQNLFNSVGRKSNHNQAQKKPVLFLSIASGSFLFLSQVLIYIAISRVTTGVAISLFFIYPMMTGLMAWFLFRERPNIFILSAISSIFCGQLLILSSYSNPPSNISWGIISGIMSGIAFAVYVILTRLSAPKLHPVSFALINFSTMLLLSFICLLVPLPRNWSVLISSNLLEVILSAFMLGVLTLCGYLFNNFGISKLGGQRSAIIGGIIPVLTVIFAGLLLQEKLDLLQILGVLLVTGGAVGISLAKMQSLVKSSSAKN
ncbi:MAG: EamA family transporter [Sphaerospermopsis sp. SIO1G2]|nr:EamA family transporter [Sphaerospermopsis sp. SIO1G2]